MNLSKFLIRKFSINLSVERNYWISEIKLWFWKWGNPEGDWIWITPNEIGGQTIWRIPPNPEGIECELVTFNPFGIGEVVFTLLHRLHRWLFTFNHFVISISKTLVYFPKFNKAVLPISKTRDCFWRFNLQVCLIFFQIPPQRIPTRKPDIQSNTLLTIIPISRVCHSSCCFCQSFIFQ